MTASRYRAFISYSHSDRRWGEWLHRALETYTPPKHLIGRKTGTGTVPARFTPVFRDRDELPSASSLESKVDDALQRSDNLVVICSPSAATSRWVNEEILTYKRMGQADRIFCLIVDGEPHASQVPGRESEECFPPALRFSLGADGDLDETMPAEPIAADARRQGDGRGNAKLKLLAGMLDLGYDSLKQRELARRHRRTTAIAAVSIVLAAVMAVLGVQAIIARQAAEVARQAADVARQAAVRRQKQAEGLIGFMLGDLDTKLNQVDRLDILEDVANKAMQYFQALPEDDVSEVGLEQRVSALQKIGSVRLGQGHADSALQAFEAARKLSRQLAVASPKNADRQAAYAESLSWVGQAQWQRGDTEAVAATFSRVGAVLKTAVGLAPNSVVMLKQVLAQATGNGRVLEAAGKLGEAEQSYQEVLDVARKLRALKPDDPEMQKEVGYAYNNLGVLAARRGDLRAASDFYARDLAIKQRIFDADPRNNSAHGEMALSLQFTAPLHEQLGQTDQAVRDYQQAIAIYGELLRLDPTQVVYMYYQGVGYIKLANLLLDSGRTEAAIAPVAQAQAMMRKAVATDPMDPKKALWLWNARLLDARMALQQGRRGIARSLAAEVETSVAALKVGDAELPTQVLLRAQALMVGADIDARGDPHAARAERVRARELLAPFITDDTRDPKLLNPWLRLAVALGSKPFPQENLDSLRQSGYANHGFVQAMARAGVAYTPSGTPVPATKGEKK